MNINQAIKTPFGVTVFGSAIMRVDPDVVSLAFAVTRLEQKPKDAFREAREAARQVQAYLTKANIGDVGTSRITLSQKHQHISGERRFVGYQARVDFHVLLTDLERMEDVLSGVINAGANVVDAVNFQTTQLKEIRAKARRRAVQAAREKAEIYCQAADVALGAVCHIEDVNPDQLRGREGHMVQQVQPDDEDPLSAFDPGSIVVGGAVIVAFELNG